MYLIVGLGNPEEEYANTRHNVGFDTINEIAKRKNIQVNRNKYNALYGQGTVEGERVILLKPQTYMNLSGVAVRNFRDFYKIMEDKIIVIYDDIDINEGVIRLRKTGGAGTHNGMKSVVQEMGSKNFSRIRIGVGKPEGNRDLKDFILEKIGRSDRLVIDVAIIKAADAIEEIIRNGIDIAMNKFN